VIWAMCGRALSCIKRKSTPINGAKDTTWSSRHSRMYLSAFMLPLRNVTRAVQSAKEMPPYIITSPPPKGTLDAKQH
jgi:hypothetical protein